MTTREEKRLKWEEDCAKISNDLMREEFSELFDKDVPPPGIIDITYVPLGEGPELPHTPFFDGEAV